VAVLADTSASVSAQDLATESSIATQVERARGRHWTRIVPFAHGTRATSPGERSKDGWKLRHTAGAAGRGAIGRLNIGILSSMAAGFLRGVVRTYRAGHPDVLMHVLEGASVEQIALRPQERVGRRLRSGDSGLAGLRSNQVLG